MLVVAIEVAVEYVVVSLVNVLTSSQRVLAKLYLTSTSLLMWISPTERGAPPDLVIVRAVSPSGAKVGVVIVLAAGARKLRTSPSVSASTVGV